MRYVGAVEAQGDPTMNVLLMVCETAFNQKTLYKLEYTKEEFTSKFSSNERYVLGLGKVVTHITAHRVIDYVQMDALARKALGV
jgi:hypothetical protein